MRFSPPEHLIDHFSAGRCRLVISGSQAFLSTPNATFSSVSGPADVQFHIVDLERLWNRFINQVDGQEEFTVGGIMKISRVDPTILTLWQGRGILHPVDDSYNLDDAFAAGLCGCLRRRGVKIQAIHKAGRFVRNGCELEVRR